MELHLYDLDSFVKDNFLKDKIQKMINDSEDYIINDDDIIVFYKKPFYYRLLTYEHDLRNRLKTYDSIHKKYVELFENNKKFNFFEVISLDYDLFGIRNQELVKLLLQIPDNYIEELLPIIKYFKNIKSDIYISQSSIIIDNVYIGNSSIRLKLYLSSLNNDMIVIKSLYETSKHLDMIGKLKGIE